MESTCSICLEQLLNGSPIGSASCGHCFHEECYGGWESAQSRRGRNTCKCPNCNESVQNFVRLFLAAPEGGGGGGAFDEDDDDVSLSSVSTHLSAEEVTTTVNGTNDDTAAAPNNENDNDNDDEQQQQQQRASEGDLGNLINLLDDSEVEERGDGDGAQGNIDNTNNNNNIGIVDLTQSPQRQSQPSVRSSTSRQVSQSSNDTNNQEEKEVTDQEQRYKRIAKRYKRKTQQLESKQREQHHEITKLIQTHKDFQNTVKELKQELQEHEGIYHTHELEVNRLNLKLVRLEFERDNLRERNRAMTKEVQSYQQKAKDLKMEVQIMKDRHQTELEKAHEHTLVETQQMMVRYPQLEAECQQLKEQIKNLQQYVSKANAGSSSGTRVAASLSGNSKKSSSSSSNHRSKFLSLAKSLRQMETAQHPTFSDHHPNPLTMTTSSNRGSSNRESTTSNNGTSTKGSGSLMAEKVNFKSGQYSGRAALMSAAAINKKMVSNSSKSTSRASDLLGPSNKNHNKSSKEAVRSNGGKENNGHRTAVGQARSSAYAKRPAVGAPPLQRTGSAGKTSLGGSKRSRVVQQELGFELSTAFGYE